MVSEYSRDRIDDLSVGKLVFHINTDCPLRYQELRFSKALIEDFRNDREFLLRHGGMCLFSKSQGSWPYLIDYSIHGNDEVSELDELRVVEEIFELFKSDKVLSHRPLFILDSDSMSVKKEGIFIARLLDKFCNDQDAIDKTGGKITFISRL